MHFVSQRLAGMLRRKRIRLLRSIFLNGNHAEKGSTWDLEQGLADDLVRQGSAVPLNCFSRFFARIYSRRK